MIIVADSGSTKCDWVFETSKGERVNTNTMGFNPFFHSTELIATQMMNNPQLKKYASDFTEVYFYGAGCSSTSRNIIVEKAIKRVFPNLKICVVDHDLLGACIATAGTSEGICCILGTGSNSCVFDGSKVTEHIPALGYVLGDEGSGSYFGKRLLRDWIYKAMPEELWNSFGIEYDLNTEVILDGVYKKPNPNVYMASFMKFTTANSDHTYIQDLVYEGLHEFATYHIIPYTNYSEKKVHFVGSVAYYFKNILEKVAEDLNFKVGKVNKRPIQAIAVYHGMKAE